MAKSPIGLGVIGVNRTNMGSTVRLLKDEPDLRYEVRAVCAARAEPLAALAREWGCRSTLPTIGRWWSGRRWTWWRSTRWTICTRSTAWRGWRRVGVGADGRTVVVAAVE